MPWVGALPWPQQTVTRVENILSGKYTLEVYKEFLSRNNNTDKLILNTTKDGIPTNSVYHSALVMSNALMYAGTTQDPFLRDNRDWLRRASNWAKFSVVASIGVIHKGHTAQARKVLEPYLPGAGEVRTTAPCRWLAPLCVCVCVCVAAREFSRARGGMPRTSTAHPLLQPMSGGGKVCACLHAFGWGWVGVGLFVGAAADGEVGAGAKAFLANLAGCPPAGGRDVRQRRCILCPRIDLRKPWRRHHALFDGAAGHSGADS